MRISDFRALIPSWLFFDDFGSGCRVYVRMGAGSDRMGSWMPAIPKHSRKAWELFHSPRAALQLFQLSSFERLLDESQLLIEEPQKLLNSDSYSVCLALLRQLPCVRGQLSLQFKIQSRLDGPNEKSDFFDAFVSPIQQVNEC